MLFTVIIILVGIIDVALSGQLRALARDALTPFANTISSAWYATMRYTDLSERIELIDKVRALEEELSHYKERDALFQVVARENAELRALARIASSSDALSAPIASSFRASPYGTFVIAAGWRDGVEAGSLVLSSEGFVLGTVVDIGMRTATVRFVFAPEARVEAVSDEIAFTLIGQGLSSASARVPVETPLRIGSPVYAPALDSLPIGLVTHIASTSASVYSDVYVTLPVNLNVMRHVRVIPREGSLVE